MAKMSTTAKVGLSLVSVMAIAGMASMSRHYYDFNPAASLFFAVCSIGTGLVGIGWMMATSDL